jgi:hypothetical protein
VRLCIAALLLCSAAYAADKAVATPQLPLAQPLTVTLSVQQWIWVMQSMQQSPVVSARDASAIIAEINRQYATAAQAQAKANK